VGLCDLARYREAEPRAPRGACIVGPVEPLEDVGKVFLGDAFARVRDLEQHPAVSSGSAHRHLAPLGGVLDGVVEQDGHRLLDALPVEACLHWAVRGDVADRGPTASRDLRRPGGRGGEGVQVVEPELERGSFVAPG
jgi:hypothetical protein